MEAIVVWVLLSLINGLGLTADAYSTKDACQEARADLVKQPDTLLVAECAPSTLAVLKRS